MCFYCKMQRIKQKMLNIETKIRGTYNISNDIQDIILDEKIHTGLCHFFYSIQALLLYSCENADPSVRIDLENFMSRLAPDGDPTYQHDMEGEKDMPAHIRSILTQTSLTIPISNGRCALGTWQGIYLWEHRTTPHRRQVIVTLQN